MTSNTAHPPTFARLRPKLPAAVDKGHAPLNPVTHLLRAASIRPTHVALIQSESRRSWNYLQWADRICNIVYSLRDVGIEAGDSVLVCAPNTPMMADLLQAVPAMSAVLVPINTRLTKKEVHHLVVHSRAKCIFVDHQSAHLFQDIHLPIIRCKDDAKVTDPYESFIRKGAALDQAQGGLGWQGIEFPRDENAIMAICYTSGTTGHPKGVEFSFRSCYIAAASQMAESQINPSTKYLWILPMFHALGWLFPYSCTAAMATQVTMRSVGTYSEVWKWFLDEGITHYCAAPTVQLSIINHPLAARLAKKITTQVAGSAPTPTLLARLLALNFDIIHVYGLTETYGPCVRTYYVDSTKQDYHINWARQGAPNIAANEVRVVKPMQTGSGDHPTSANLCDVAADGKEVGEIIMRGNMVMQRYFRDPDATAKAFVGNYFRSGDLAVQHPDGTIAIQDRSKDMIISGGENISSLAVESEIATHPDVLEVAVIAESHPTWGERPHAFIVLRPESKWQRTDNVKFAQDLHRFLKPLLVGFAIPDRVTLVEDLEKSSTGKVAKNVYRQLLAQTVKSKL